MIDIDKLEAGWELDGLIAIKIFGKAAGAVYEYIDMPDEHGREMISPCGTLKDIPRYSTDIAAAWEVVEKMRAHWKRGGDGLEIWSRFSHALWKAFYPWGGDENDAWDVCLRNIDALAICRAALKAVGA